MPDIAPTCAAGGPARRPAADPFSVYPFDNGLTLLVERMSGVKSAAMTLLLPAGAATDPIDRCGASTVLCDNVFRGAGDFGNRELTAHLDRLGLQRSSGVGIHHARYAVACVAEKMTSAIGIYADIVRRPHLPEDGFEASRDLALQALAGLEDDPRGKVMVRLREWHWPSPYSRPTMGRVDDLKKLTNDLIRTDHARRYRPNGAILAVAGDVASEQIRDAVAEAFGDWSPGTDEPITVMPSPGHRHHESAESEQTHIGVACDAPPETSDDYYAARLANEVLSGSMSSRLFTEVREKRGLCYSVGVGYASLPGQGSLLGYAGTSNERAQKTLDQVMIEIHRLHEGVEADELQRAKVGLKSATVMSGESSGARAAALAHDWFVRGRLRPLGEILDAIDVTTLDRVNAYLRERPPTGFTVVTIGPGELRLPEGLRLQT